LSTYKYKAEEEKLTKKLKTFVSSFLAVVMLCLASMTCFAADTSSQPLTGPTKMFVEMCDNLFNNPTKYRALDKGQNDVTNAFVNSHVSDYQNNNYDALWDAFRAELYAITWRTEKKIDTRGSVATRTVEDSFYVVDGTTGTRPEFAFEMLYTVSGDYSYDISTYEFLDHSSARVSVDSFHAGDYFTYSVKNENSNVRVNGNQIKFTGSFSLDVTVIFGKTIGFGPYYGTVTGYAQ